jgi:hypothetical protein
MYDKQGILISCTRSSLGKVFYIQNNYHLLTPYRKNHLLTDIKCTCYSKKIVRVMFHS